MHFQIDKKKAASRIVQANYQHISMLDLPYYEHCPTTTYAYTIGVAREFLGASPVLAAG